MESLLHSFLNGLYITFIQDNNYQLFIEGLKNTLIVTLFAALIGIVLGSLLGIAKSQCEMSGKMKPLNRFITVYLAVFRGIPTLVQVMIWYFVILGRFIDSGVVVAIIALGINSSAYVCEIIRSGFLSVDGGQNEAGQSLGLKRFYILRYIILPQAMKISMPALCNEFITLLKETSVIFVITVVDLSNAAMLIRTSTMQAFFPLIFVAIVYLLLCLGLNALSRMLERRLRKSDLR